MISSIKYMPILLSTVVFTASVLFKVLLVQELKLTYFWRDIILFFILYYVVGLFTKNIERIMKNYWKML